MNKIKEFFKSNWQILLVLFSLFLFFKSCSETREANKRVKMIEKAYIQKMDSLHTEVLKRIEIESLKSNKRLLQDMNYIVLTKTRPDSAIKQYDFQIEQLSK
jgi:hypothetical protein